MFFFFLICFCTGKKKKQNEPFYLFSKGYDSDCLVDLEDGFIRPPSWMTVTSLWQSSAGQCCPLHAEGMSWRFIVLETVSQLVNSMEITCPYPGTEIPERFHRAGLWIPPRFQHHISFWPFKERHPWVAPLFWSTQKITVIIPGPGRDQRQMPQVADTKSTATESSPFRNQVNLRPHYI